MNLPKFLTDKTEGLSDLFLLRPEDETKEISKLRHNVTVDTERHGFLKQESRYHMDLSGEQND